MYSLGNVFEQPSLKDLLYGVVVRLEGSMKKNYLQHSLVIWRESHYHGAPSNEEFPH